MIKDIIGIVFSKEIFLVTIAVICLFCILNPKITLPFFQMKRKQKVKYSQKSITKDLIKPGKILVPDSTYETLMKEKGEKK